MSDTDGMCMRNLMIFALAVVIVGMAVIPTEVTDAETYPSELAVLQFWNGADADVIYVYPDRPIGDIALPTLPGYAEYWVRMDTGEVVTSSSVFSPGTYLITAYTWQPEPWGGSTGPSGTPDNTLAITAVVLSTVAIITGVTAIYVVLRRK